MNLHVVPDPDPQAYRVWWVPQIPMKAFEVIVPTLDEAKRLCATLANYDRFQYDNNIKPDYANVGGITEFIDGEWCDVDEEFDPDPRKAALQAVAEGLDRAGLPVSWPLPYLGEEAEFDPDEEYAREHADAFDGLDQE